MQSNNNNNGNYVSSAEHPLPATDLPKVPSHMAALNPKTAPLSDLVTHFSAIYQHYQEVANRYKAAVAAGTSSAGASSAGANSNAKLELQWAEYYLDLSTRAAHHYNDLLTKQRQGQLLKKQRLPVVQQTQHVQTLTQHVQTTQTQLGAPPLSFQQYAHRNLSRCTDNTQKLAMTELIQITIQKAIRDGTMHTKQWDYEPLLPLPAVCVAPANAAPANAAPANAPASSHSRSHSHSHSHSSHSSNIHSHRHGKSSYLDALLQTKTETGTETGTGTGTGTVATGTKTGAGSAAGAKRKTSNYEETLPINDSYYGSSFNSNTIVHRNDTNINPKKKKIYKSSLSSPTSSKSNYYNPQYSDYNDYDTKLPSNDSYYGRTSCNYNNNNNNNDDDDDVQTTHTHSNNNNNNNNKKNNQDFKFGDYISLSSLSTDKYIKKKNKLVKASSTLTTSSTTSSSSSSIIGKKKSNIIANASTNNNTSTTKLASRLHRFSGQGGIANATSNTLHSEYKHDIDKYMGKTVIGSHSKKQLDEQDYEQMTVKGTCTILEKEYLRLTAPPKAELVRPQHVLQQHLIHLKKLWKKSKKNKYNKNNKNSKNNKNKDGNNNNNNNNTNNSNSSSIININIDNNNNNKQKDYNWFCSQLKAIRQDLTVQRIFNDFAVDVYETHAKLALEEGDLNEYNQSQTQLKELYELLSHNNFNKNNDTCNNGLKNQNEFIAYRIIYYVFLTGNKKYDGGSSDLFKIMLNLTLEQREDVHIAHALKVRIAVAENDYHSFFRLQDNCPNVGACYLMDLMIGQIRAVGLQCMMKAYRPSLAVEFILQELGFCNKDNYGEEIMDTKEGISWLKHCGCKFSEDDKFVLAKDTVLNESNLIQKQVSSLI